MKEVDRKLWNRLIKAKSSKLDYPWNKGLTKTSIC